MHTSTSYSNLSLSRPQSRIVDVNDLRLALGMCPQYPCPSTRCTISTFLTYSHPFSYTQPLHHPISIITQITRELITDGRQSTNTSRAPSLRSSSFRSPSRSQLHLNAGSAGTERPRSRLSSPTGVNRGDAPKDILNDIFQNRHKSQEGFRRDQTLENGSGLGAPNRDRNAQSSLVNGDKATVSPITVQ